MKFRLCEDLQEDLQAEEQERNNIVDIVSEILTSEGFKDKDELNGVSFTKTVEGVDGDSYCQFYLDTDRDTYSSYITDGGTVNSYTFQQKGELKDAINACNQFTTMMKSVDMSTGTN